MAGNEHHDILETKVADSSSSMTPEKNAKGMSPARTMNFTFPSAIKKKVKDVVVNFHGIIQKWRTLNQTSLQTLTSLDSTCEQLQASNEQCQSIESSLSLECWKYYKADLIKLRESLLKDHRDHMMQMNELHVRLENIVLNLEAIDLMNTVNPENVATIKADIILFSSWTTRDFYMISRSVLNCYTKEWLHKQELSKALTQEVSSKVRTSLLLSMWLQEPYLTEEAEFTFESMLLECGFK